MCNIAQEVLSGPHTRVRVDTVANPQASPPGKKTKGGRQMGLASFYRGVAPLFLQTIAVATCSFKLLWELLLKWKH